MTQWRQDTSEDNQNWENFKRNFLTRFTRIDSDLHIAWNLKELRQTGSISKYIQEYEKLRLKAPPSMSLDNAFARLNFFDGLKPQIHLHMNIERCDGICTIYLEAELAEQKAEALNKAYNNQRP